MEYLGLPAVEAIERLNSRNIKFKMNYTVPIKGYFKVDDSKLYIIRVKVLDDDSLELTVTLRCERRCNRQWLIKLLMIAFLVVLVQVLAL